MPGHDGAAAPRRGSQEALLRGSPGDQSRVPPTLAPQQPDERQEERSGRANVQQRVRSQRWQAAQAPDDDPLGDNSPCRWMCRQIGRVVLGTLGVVLAIVWLFVGRLLSLQTLAPPALLIVLTWGGVAGLYAQLLSSTPCGLDKAVHHELSHGYSRFDTSLLDAVVAFVVASLAAALCGGWAASSTILRPRRCALLPVAIVVIMHTGLATAKLIVMQLTDTIATDESSSDAGSGSSANFANCALETSAVGWLLTATQTSVILTAAWSSRIWAQATPERLKAAERKLVETRVNGRQFRQRVVAGIGTLEAGPVEDTAVDESLPSEEPVRSTSTPPIVLIHGLGAGNGLWCENIEALSARHRLLCVEWRGCGRSDRSKFTARTYGDTLEWFLPAFARWFEAMDLLEQPVILVGHSMGAMLATEWTLRHPSTVRRLVLASPAGVPERPPGPSWSNNPNLAPQWRFLRWLWMHHITPFTAIRLLGPLARTATRRLLLWRVSRVPQTSRSRLALQEPFASILTEYMFQNLNLQGSGENAMVTMLQPGAFAPHGEALEQKLLALPLEVPLSFIYGGTRDWMTSSHGARIVEARRVAEQRGEQDSASLDSEGQKMMNATGYGPSTITVLESAGHHVMLDAADEFNAAILAAANG